MQKSRFMLKALVLILLLMSLALYYVNIGESAEIEYVPRGWTSSETGYFLNEEAGRDILEGWSSDRTAKAAYKASLDELYSEWQIFRGNMMAQIAEIKEAHAQERSQWQKSLRRAGAPGFGFFAGAGYTAKGELQATVGIGLVWKIF